MALLNINFDSVPDHYVPIPTGVYDAEITKIPEIAPTASGDGTKVVVELKITTDGDQKDREITDHISMKMKTTLKNLFQSAGVPAGAQGADLADLLNKIVKVKISVDSYVDKVSKETKETNRVKEYLFTAA